MIRVGPQLSRCLLLLAGLAAPGTGMAQGADFYFSVLAGSPTIRGETDGVGGNARFHSPRGIAVDLSGHVYISSIPDFPYTAALRKISPDGVVTTPGLLNFVEVHAYDLAVDTAGNLYAADTQRSMIVKFAPQGGFFELGFNMGPFLSGVTVDEVGNVFAAAAGSGYIWKITPQGVQNPSARFTGSQVLGPRSVELDSAGNIYVAFPGNNTIQKIEPYVGITTFATVPSPFGLAVDRAGNVYAGNGSAFQSSGSGTISRVTPDGEVAAVVASADPRSRILGVAVDEVGNVYAADEGLHVIWKGLTTHPSNDAFALAARLPNNSARVQFNNTGASTEPGEPDHGGGSGGHSVWFKWASAAAQPVTLRADGVPVQVAVYTGESLASLVRVEANGGGNVASFNAEAGETYYLAVDARGEGGGNVTLYLNDGYVLAWGPPPQAAFNGTLSGLTVVPSLVSPVVAIKAGSHSLALTLDGRVVQWGAASPPLWPVPANLTQVVGIIPMGSGGLAIKSDGTAAAWGPSTNLTGVTDAIAIAPSATPSTTGMVLRRDGTVVPFGSPLYFPVGLRDVAALCTTGSFLTAVGVLRNDGTVMVYGTVPAPPSSLTNVVALALGQNAALALRSDGTVTAWGTGEAATALPADLSDVVAISSGVRHAVALRSDGSLVGWGNNTSGQLDFPADLKGVVGIAAGSSHTLALLPAAPPHFSVPPVSGANSAGQPVVITAWANALDYQWFAGPSGDTSAPVPGATKPWLVVPNLAQNTSFWVRATNGFGSTDSAAAMITVFPNPSNDNFTAAAPLAGASAQVTATNAGATLEPGEPAPPGGTSFAPLFGAHSVWWNWTAPADGLLTVDTVGSDFNTLLGVYAGDSVAALSLLRADNDSGGNFTSRLATSVAAGQTYRLRVDGANGALGQLRLQLALASMPTPKAAWLAAHFTPVQLAEPQVSGDLAAPAGDGVPNLLKYAFDLAPLSLAPNLFPAPLVEDGALTLAFTAVRPELAYQVQVSTDLAHWSTAGIVVEVNGANVRARYDLAQAPAGRAYFRIVVTVPEPPAG